MKLLTIPIDKIDEGTRFRADYGDINTLVESIKEKEIVQPLAVCSNPYYESDIGDDSDTPYRLLAGGRRLRAAKLAGLSKVPVRVYDQDLTDLEMREIELTENLFRKDLHWAEEDKLKEEIHRLKIEKYGEKTTKSPDDEGWSGRETAKFLGESQTTTARSLQMAEALKVFPELAECKTESDANKLLDKMKSDYVKEEKAKQFEEISAKTPLGRKRKNLVDSFILKDYFIGIENVDSETVDLIELDPPFAISLEQLKKSDGVVKATDDYNEIPAADYELFMEKVLEQSYRVLKPEGFIIVWFAPEPWFEYIYKIINNVGFNVRRIPCIWTKGTGQTMRPEYHPAHSYEMFFYGRKGAARLNRQGRGDVFDYKPVNPDKKIHPTERPIELLEDILDTFGPLGSRVVVPFVGSGTTLLAAANIGMTAFGYELTQRYKDRYTLKVFEGEPGRYKSYV